MLLGATADNRFWAGADEVLFLGSWCVPVGAEGALAGRRYRIVPYHWNDRGKLHRDGLMLWRRYEATLPALAGAMNVWHQTDHSVAYWRAATGYALLGAMTLVKDRMDCLLAAVNEGATHIFAPRQPLSPPVSYGDMMAKASASDFWNQVFVAHLSRNGLPIRVETIEVEQPAYHLPPQGPKASLKRAVRSMGRFVPRRIAFVDMGLPLGTLARLEFGQRQIPLPVSSPAPKEVAVRSDLRASFHVDCGGDEFGRICSAVLPQLFPTALLEGYSDAVRQARRAFPNAPRAIVTAQAQYNEIFSQWAAAHQERGVPTAIEQHGGHYGTDLTELAEDQEIRSADRYFTWGWTRKECDTAVPMPALKLVPWKKRRLGKQNGDLLAVYDAGHRYPYRIYSVPIAGQRLDDNQLQLSLLESLPVSLRKALRLRIHPVPDGYGFREKIAALGFAAQLDKSRTLMEAAKNARLCIAANNSTSMLELLVSGVPTLVFYDTRLAEVREEAAPYFQALERVGILFNDPQKLAAKIASVWNDPLAWWNTDEVARAHVAFANRFCAGTENWAAVWKTGLENLVRTNSSSR